ncbi:PREDICTED: uncharacterized protein LOC104806758 [Tarenaya hassleriana]|uniref:uncharacterized protein LOC104806758 n=1 Tax=Tarenaya hassleriana TaxID=28532 RepID=UPI00053C7899|nr:PREDICTED: uncharacterized protein LOC104806758 [Tarenaya hassleriana]
MTSSAFLVCPLSCCFIYCLVFSSISLQFFTMEPPLVIYQVCRGIPQARNSMARPGKKKLEFQKHRVVELKATRPSNVPVALGDLSSGSLHKNGVAYEESTTNALLGSLNASSWEYCDKCPTSEQEKSATKNNKDAADKVYLQWQIAGVLSELALPMMSRCFFFLGFGDASKRVYVENVVKFCKSIL